MTKYLDENGLLYLWGKLKATFLHNASEGRFTGVSTNTSTGLRTFNVPTIAEHIYYDSNKNSTLKDKIDTIVSQGGEPNTIETVKVNGTALVPDANKAVNITFTDNDTKNTAGATVVTFNASTEKLYLIGAKEQTANPQTYTNNSTYIDNSSGLHTGSIYASTINSSSQITASSFRVENSELGVMFVNLTNGGEIEMTVDTLHASSGNVPPTVPTASAGDNSTKIATTAFVTNAINNAIGGVTGITYEVVQTLPATGAVGTIYLISNSGTNPNIYDEYIYVNNGFEKIGTTDVDLTNYWSKTELIVIPNTTIDYIVTNNTLPTT